MGVKWQKALLRLRATEGLRKKTEMSVEGLVEYVTSDFEGVIGK